MAKAGYTALIRRSGTSTAVTTEPMTNVADGKTFQITLEARRALDPLTAFHFKSGTSTIEYTDISSLNWEFGEVTFLTAYSTLSTSFSGSYLPLSTADEVITEVKGFTLSESSDLLDKTVFTSTSRFVKRIYGLADAEVNLDVLVNVTDQPGLATLQHQGTMLMLEITGGASTMFRGYGKLESFERTGSVDGMVEGTITWKLAAERESETGRIAGYSVRTFTS